MISSQASLQIGFWGNFYENRYQIIGVGVWNMDYREYYSSEGKTGYENSSWRYVEWVLFDPINNRVAYLIEDKEGFSFSEAYEPVKKIVPEFADNQFVDFMGNSSFRVIEYGTAYLQDFEGDNGFAEYPEPQAKHFFVYENGKTKYSIEYPLSENGNPMLNQRDYYKANKISFSHVLEAFKENPAIKNKKESQSTLRFATTLARLTAWAFFVLFCYSFFSYSLVFKHTFDIKNGKIDSLGAPTMDTLTEFFSPTWEIKKANEVYLIETDARLAPMLIGRNPCDMYVQTAIIDEEAGVVNQMAGEFWAETGSDSDGYWSESERNKSIYVRSEKPGKFSAWLSVERMPDMLEWTAQIDINVYKYQFLWWYMLIYWLLALGVRVILGSMVKA